jgi:Lon protease-like protein
LFGLTYHPDSAVGTVAIPVVGSIGCAAHVMSVVPLEDDRSNILTAGLCRYKTLEYITQDPYLIAAVEFFEDRTSESDVPMDLVQSVTDLFLRFLRAIRTLRDAPMARQALPEPLEQLSFAIASAVLTEAEDQFEVLEMRSTEERFQYLESELMAMINDIEERASEHTAMKSNGHRKGGWHGEGGNE